jgi:hypothetical protein
MKVRFEREADTIAGSLLSGTIHVAGNMPRSALATDKA